MYVPDQIPILIFQVLEGNVSENAFHCYISSIKRVTSIVNEDVDSAKCLDSSLDNLVSIDDGIVVCNSFSTGFLDLCKSRSVSSGAMKTGQTEEFTFNDDIGGLRALALSFERTAKIVYDDTGAARGKERGIRLSKATLTNGSADVLCRSRGGPITSSAGDNDDPVIIAQFSAEIRHGCLCLATFLPCCGCSVRERVRG